MKKILLMFAAASLTLPALADGVPEGLTITPNADETTATVTKCDESLAGEVVIPSVATIDGKDYTVTAIGNSAFSQCEQLSSIILPTSLKTISQAAFYRTGITSIIIPDGVTEIQTNAFLYCKSLVSIELPESVTLIGSRAFNSCSALSSIIIPENITKIESQTFYYCEGLKSVTLPESLTEIGDKAFYRCNSLTSIDFPENLTAIGTEAFYYSGLTSLELPAGIAEISTKAFMGSKITILDIPDGVTAIAYGAFGNIAVLKDITIPASVTTIGNQAFYNNYPQDGIQRITVLAAVPPTLGSEVFTTKDKNATVIVPAEALDAYKAADGWNEFANLRAETVSSLGPDVMYTINEDGTSITITGWPKAEGDIEIPATATIDGKEYTVSAIAPGTLANNTKLTSVAISAPISEIPENTFYGCTALTSVTVPQNLDTIGNNAFNGCSSLKDVNFPTGITTIGDRAFRNCSALKEVTLPEGLTSLGLYAFENCSELQTIVFPSQLKDVPNFCCQNCPNLKYVEFGAGTTSIGVLAFYKDDNIEQVKVWATTPPRIYYTAEGLSFTSTAMQKSIVSVPEGCTDSYKADQFWSSFRNYNTVSGIEDAAAPTITVTGRYSIDGHQVDANYRGIVVTRYSDGSITKNIIR